MKVICNKSGYFKACDKCLHSRPHEPCYDPDKCTLWDDCWNVEDIGWRIIRVRCTKRKKK